MNLTQIEVKGHWKLPKELDIRLVYLNHYLQDTYAIHVRDQNLIQTVIVARDEIDHYTLKLHRQFEVETILNYIEALTTDQTMCLLVPPDLRNVLAEEKKVMAPHPCLDLPTGPDYVIWSYYQLLQGILMVHVVFL